MLISDKDELETVLNAYGKAIGRPIASTVDLAKEFGSGYVHFYRSSLHQTKKIWDRDLETLFTVDKEDDAHYHELSTPQKIVYNLGTGTAIVTGGGIVSLFNMFLSTPLYFKTIDPQKGKGPKPPDE